MKEKKTSGDVGRSYSVGGAAGKAGNCENPGECKKKCRNIPVPGGNRKVRRRGTEKERKKLSVTK